MSHLPQDGKPSHHENNNGGLMDNTPNSDTYSSSSSFVGKVRSTLSKWFATPQKASSRFVRPRTEMEADDSCNNDSDDESEDQLHTKLALPPAKRLKTTTEASGVFNSASVNNNNTQLRLFSQVGLKNPKRLVLNRRNNSSLLHQTQQDSDSGESTSGYSSMPRHAVTSKREETHLPQVGVQPEEAVLSTAVPSSSAMINLHNRSLFDTSHDRSLLYLQSTATSPINTSLASARPPSLSTRRPAFCGATLTAANPLSNTTTTTTSSSSNGGLLDRTIATRRIYNSPFYSGRTLYGGASNATIGPLPPPPPPPPQPARLGSKPAVDAGGRDSNGTSGSSMLSSTARRILDTLESYTLDSAQQRKLPGQPTRRHLQQDHLFAARASKPYSRAGGQRSQPPLGELHVPNVAQLLKMKERLQTQTVLVRQMIKESTQQQAAASSGSGKVRTKVSAPPRPHKQHGPEPGDEDTSGEVERLSAIQLPISVLPRFTDLQLPLPRAARAAHAASARLSPPSPPVAPGTATSTAAPSAAPPAATLTPPAVPRPRDKQDEQIFVFAKPLVLLDSGLNGSKLRNIAAINNFKFSVPLNQKLIHKLTQQIPPPGRGDPAKGNPCIATDTMTVAASSSEQDNGGSAGFGETFTLAKSAQWECGVCLVRNPAAALACLACTTLRPPHTKPPTVSSSDFGTTFKLSTSAQWECDVCMVRNPTTALACLACTTSKPGVGAAWSDTLLKPSANKWECDVCLVSNYNSAASCAACETPKARAGAAPTWECPSCMVRNQRAALKCVCCETLRPGANTTTAATACAGSSANLLTKYNFGVTPAAAPTLGFTFGIPSAQSARAITVTATTSPSVATAAAAPGTATTTQTTVTTNQSKQVEGVGFTFGIPSQAAAAVSTTRTAAAAVPTLSNGSGNNSSSAVSSTTMLNQLQQQQQQQQKPFPNGMISSSSTPPAATPSATALPTGQVAALAGIKFGAASHTLALGGRPPTAATTTVAQDVSSSTNVIARTSASACSSVSSTAAAAAVAAPTTSQQQPFTSFSFGGSESAGTAKKVPLPPPPPIFSFGQASSSTNNSATTAPQSNGPFIFGGVGAPTAAPAVAAATSGTSPSLFSFGGAPPTAPSVVTAPAGFGFSNNSTNSATCAGAAAPPFGAAVAAPSVGNVCVFGPPKLKNGGFDFSSSTTKGLQIAATAPTTSVARFSFATPSAATTMGGGAGVFSFGPSGNNAAMAGTAAAAAAAGANGAAPFTFGAVSSSSSNSNHSNNAGDGSKPPAALLLPPPPHPPPLSFGGITSSSASPHVNMFGAPAGAPAQLHQQQQQRRIIRKAVRRTNTQPR